VRVPTVGSARSGERHVGKLERETGSEAATFCWAGIGLAFVKRLLEEAGGNVGATSMAGSTTFWFTLPTA
jgi:signal transduction histidine kinase